MVVSFTVKAGHEQVVRELFEVAMPRIRAETGCLEFRLFTELDSNVAWIYERWITKRYHDEVHESYSEIQTLLHALPPHLDGPSAEHGLRQVLER